jgi:hypothetical protein
MVCTDHTAGFLGLATRPSDPDRVARRQMKGYVSPSHVDYLCKYTEHRFIDYFEGPILVHIT